MTILFIFRIFFSLNFAFLAVLGPQKACSSSFWVSEFLLLISEDQHIDYFYRLSLFFWVHYLCFCFALLGPLLMVFV